MPGDSYVSCGEELIETLLGSCVSACIRDVNLGVGGMNHFLLPETERNIASEERNRYGIFAMKALLRDLKALGAQDADLEVKVAGGGKVMSGMFDIGKENIRFAKVFLDSIGLHPAAIDVGGTSPRRILYDPLDGKLMVKKLGDRDSFRAMAYEAKYRLGAQSPKPSKGRGVNKRSNSS